ncbi:ABC transporter permease [Corynebacterium meridianum]|uniref:Iron chelate uptake ABC transporter family permease subunit n=1 Tax=Corynebacterium meridianum TaxID=2765363 RepID=A0A934I633_9CORY|nr:iron chelate uptake ABC transporter family permease subunit [Corynebacterium meridianum]MBI8989034.1 iron chelate uptake ABC transporter family permease subunit [Corynebacterium meridianum]MCK7676680.1 iron chelate uptake ABC transporter family permease subunit [Corynebacterium meridianum]
MRFNSTTLLLPAVLTLAALSAVSLLVGVADSEWRIMVVSRIPRTVAILLSGATIAVAGLLMQLLARNRFVEPSTVGTTESAALGLLLVTLFFPAAPIGWKMVAASLTALAGTALFLGAIRRIPNPGLFTVPLVGIMLGSVIGAVATFIAYNYGLLQSLGSWQLGSYAGVLRGRYELLWIIGILVIVSYVAADRFTILGLGHSYAVNAGINARAVEAFGLAVVAVVSAVTVTVVGAIPFLGLVVPNLVSAVMGDNTRRSLPWVALVGAMMCMVCDILGRTIRFPYEMPVGTVMGVLGAAIFLAILYRRNARVRC